MEKNQSNEKKESVSISIDDTTSKGVFADGFAIALKGDIAVLDFAFNTPEGTFRITSRTIMPLGMLKALGIEIEKRIERKSKNVKKKKTKKV